MADPFVTQLNQQYSNFLGGKSDPFTGAPSGNIDYAKLVQGQPSLAVPSALQTIGKSQYGPFGSYIMSTVAPNLNNIFEALTPVGSANDNPQGRANFYDEYVAGLYNANSPYNVSYGDVGKILNDALGGSSDTLFSDTLRKTSGDAVGQASAIDDFIKGFGSTTMSATKVNLMEAQLGNMLSDYAGRVKNGSLDSNSTSFVQYLVSRSADFLDRFFGQQSWTAVSPNDFSDPLANSNSSVTATNTPPPIVQGNNQAPR